MPADPVAEARDRLFAHGCFGRHTIELIEQLIRAVIAARTPASGTGEYSICSAHQTPKAGCRLCSVTIEAEGRAMPTDDKREEPAQAGRQDEDGAMELWEKFEHCIAGFDDFERAYNEARAPLEREIADLKETERRYAIATAQLRAKYPDEPKLPEEAIPEMLRELGESEARARAAEQERDALRRFVGWLETVTNETFVRRRLRELEAELEKVSKK